MARPLRRTTPVPTDGDLCEATAQALEVRLLPSAASCTYPGGYDELPAYAAAVRTKLSPE